MRTHERPPHLFSRSPGAVALGVVLLVATGCGRKTEKATAPVAAHGAAEKTAAKVGSTVAGRVGTKVAGRVGTKVADRVGDKGGAGPVAAARTPAGGAGTRPVKAPEAVQPPPRTPSIATADLQTLLNAWLKAQNDGDFKAYSALYAARFFGIKRSGPRTRSFRREGWLRDRKRMFAKAMQVQAAKVEMMTSAESAVIGFEQTWASGTYKDVGPKQLVVVREGDTLRIAREEMLRSEIAADDARAAKLGRDTFGFVIDADGAQWVVLDDRPDARIATGPARLLAMEPRAVVVRDADRARIPAAAAALVGKEMRLYGPMGQICRGHLRKVAMIARVRPHFGTVAYWKGEEGGRKLPEARVAEEAWSLGDAGRLLVGRIDPVEGDRCRGAMWARKAELVEPPLATAARVEPALLRLGLRKLRALRGYKEIKKTYIELTELPRPRFWDRYDGAAPKISTLASADGKQRFLAVAARAGSGCGDFFGEYWAIWSVRGPRDKPSLVLLTDGLAPGRYFVPRMAVDLDGDGRYEFLSTDALLQPVGPVVRETRGIEVPDLDCPC